MKDNVLEIRKTRPVASVVANLERMLAHAKAGKLTALIGLAKREDEMLPFRLGEIGPGWAVYGLERLKLDVIADASGNDVYAPLEGG